MIFIGASGYECDQVLLSFEKSGHGRNYILNSNIMEFDKNLQNGEKELRNRRFIEEADAVKLARQVVISIMVDIYEKEHSDGNDRKEGN